jgi:hypothetical protein
MFMQVKKNMNLTSIFGDNRQIRLPANLVAEKRNRHQYIEYKRETEIGVTRRVANTANRPKRIGAE